MPKRPKECFDCEHFEECNNRRENRSETCLECGQIFRVITWKHLKKHNLTIKQYEEKYNIVVGSTLQKGLTKSFCPRIKRSVENKKGKFVGWNKGLTKKDHPGILAYSQKMSGTGNSVHKIKDINKWKENLSKRKKGIKTGPISDERRQTLSVSAKKRKIHGHTGHKHTPETKDVLRQKTIERLKNTGTIKVSQLEKRVFEEIKKIVPFAEMEKLIGFYSIDIFIEPFWCIEVLGDYWHANPIWMEKKGIKEPNATQKRNLANDQRRKTYLTNRGYKIIPMWENDINNNLENEIERLFLEVRDFYAI